MKNKILLLIIASVIALLALSAIQGYLISNTYTLKKDAFITETKQSIVELDNHPTLDSLSDVLGDHLEDHISDFLNQRIDKIELNNRFFLNARRLSPIYERLYKKEYEKLELGYDLEYSKRLLSLIIIHDSTIDTLFPISESGPITIVGEVMDPTQSSTINSSRTFSEITYFAEEGEEFISKTYELEARMDNKVLIKDWRSIMFRKMALLLFSSILIFLFVIGILYYSIRKWISQKKINEIKTDFINNITHELKTPLATLSIASKSLENEKIRNSPKALDSTLKIVSRQNDRLQKLIDQVMNNSLSSTDIILSKEIITDNNYFQDLLSDFSLATQEKNIQIVNQVIGEEVYLRIDKFHFSTAVLNILENAVKYGKDKVKITIQTLIEKGNYIIKISDNGIGIPSQKYDEIFNKFYRVSDGDVHNVKGLGLGLYYTKQIIIAHNGAISVQSELNKGTTFRIQIPMQA